jgi:hypothetical protein
VTIFFPASQDGNQKNEKRVSLIVCLGALESEGWKA